MIGLITSLVLVAGLAVIKFRRLLDKLAWLSNGELDILGDGGAMNILLSHRSLPFWELCENGMGDGLFGGCSGEEEGLDGGVGMHCNDKETI